MALTGKSATTQGCMEFFELAMAGQSTFQLSFGTKICSVPELLLLEVTMHVHVSRRKKGLDLSIFFYLCGCEQSQITEEAGHFHDNWGYAHVYSIIAGHMTSDQSESGKSVH